VRCDEPAFDRAGEQKGRHLKGRWPPDPSTFAIPIAMREQNQEFIPLAPSTDADFVPFAGVVRSVDLASVFDNRTTNVADSAASGRGNFR